MNISGYEEVIVSGILVLCLAYISFSDRLDDWEFRKQGRKDTWRKK
jgi:hypothetical protein